MSASNQGRCCRECRAPLAGRSDKKFCDDACRNSYNNRQHYQRNKEMRRINRILARNYRILESLNPGDSARCSKQELMLQGFDFHHFTSIRRSSQGFCYYFVYNLAYLFLTDENLVLIRQERLQKASL